MDAMSSDDVTAQPEASSETGAITDTGIPADTGVTQDADVVVDTGVLDSDACRPPSRLCAGRCVDTATDTANCGACGYRCPAAPAGFTATCAAGFCRYGAACGPAYGDCNRTVEDGYEVNLDSSSTHCGACGTTCAVGTRCCNGACRSTSQSCDPCE
jgi:hypothetical protein